MPLAVTTITESIWKSSKKITNPMGNNEETLEDGAAPRAVVLKYWCQFPERRGNLDPAETEACCAKGSNTPPSGEKVCAKRDFKF